MTICSKNSPFLLRLNYDLKRYLQKEKTYRAISYRDSRLSALYADRPPVNKINQIVTAILRLFVDIRSLIVAGIRSIATEKIKGTVNDLRDAICRVPRLKTDMIQHM
jgi:hypothetical protein